MSRRRFFANPAEALAAWVPARMPKHKETRQQTAKRSPICQMAVMLPRSMPWSRMPRPEAKKPAATVAMIPSRSPAAMQAFHCHAEDRGDSLWLKGVVSRKKQMVPALMLALQGH